MQSLSLPRFYLILPPNWARAALFDYLDCALQAGVRLVQLREKNRDAVQTLSIAKEFVAHCQAYNALSIINDSANIAAQSGASGVHLGGEDGSLTSARAALGETAIIGASCYNRLDSAQTAAAQGASYLAFGALFASSTKPLAKQAPLELFSQAAALNRPLVGIGGITAQNCDAVFAAGAASCAVISDFERLYNAANKPQSIAAMKHYLAQFEPHEQ